eukprot:476815-Amphidinium_carterae.2
MFRGPWPEEMLQGRALLRRIVASSRVPHAKSWRGVARAVRGLCEVRPKPLTWCSSTTGLTRPFSHCAS